MKILLVLGATGTRGLNTDRIFHSLFCLFVFSPKFVLCSYFSSMEKHFFFYGAGNKLMKTTQGLVGFITVWRLLLKKEQSLTLDSSQNVHARNLIGCFRVRCLFLGQSTVSMYWLTSAVSTDLVDPEDGNVEQLETGVLGRQCCKCLSCQRFRF